MAQQLLHGPQVARGLQHVAGKRMSQHVRMDVLWQAPSLGQRIHPQLYRTVAQPPPLQRQEKRRRIGCRMRRQPLATNLQPGIQRSQCRTANRHRATFSALAQHLHLGRRTVQPGRRTGSVP